MNNKKINTIIDTLDPDKAKCPNCHKYTDKEEFECHRFCDECLHKLYEKATINLNTDCKICNPSFIRRTIYKIKRLLCNTII